MRETLFNWLMPELSDARCLDLFAGTGVLGFEALSRGAAQAVFVEQDAKAAEHLTATYRDLDATGVRVVRDDVLRFLSASPANPFDVVFIDPPYQSAIRERVCWALERGGWLAAGARVYVETETAHPVVVPPAWQPYREGEFGRVCVRLYTVPG